MGTKKVFMSLIVVSIFFMLLVSNSRPARAGAGTITVFTFDQTNLTGHIEVSCPGNIGFDWQVGDESNVFDEETRQHGDFYFPKDKVSFGHHNAIAQLHCANESWDNATKSTVGFDWYGGNPTSVPVPVQQSTNPPPQGTSVATGKFSQAADDHNGVNIVLVCQLDGYSTAVNTDGSASGWVCQRSDGSTVPVEWNSTCRDVYGSSYGAYTVGGSAGDVRCGQNQNNPPQALNSPTPSSTPFVPEKGNGCDLSQPKQVNNGDTVSITEIGSPLNVRNSPSLSGSIVAKLYIGTQVQILGDSQCGDGYRWWPINTGWIAESGSDGLYIVTANSDENASLPTITPDPTDDFSQQANACSNAPTVMNGRSLESGIEAKVSSQVLQCVAYIRMVYPKLLHDCPSVHGDAWEWKDLARKSHCGLSVNPPTDVCPSDRTCMSRIDYRDIRVGDIAVWGRNCGYGSDKAVGPGHVAIVLSFNIDLTHILDGTQTITTRESDWPVGSGIATHTHQIYDTCMSFIHVPYQLPNPMP